ncbi:hypothetical protein [Arcobacter sp. YIC-310]|uniref:hypothetical protein n=1 Tax=Arcobacter sp. YIC-310 TaxID=3376632 RepID=UPI003C1D0367
MNNIHYINDEPLAHLDSTRRLNSFIWRIMYKRVCKNIDTSILNIKNIKKILFNKNGLNQMKIEATLPYVSINNETMWYLADDQEEYYLPLSISFTDSNMFYDIVLIDGKIDIRVKDLRKKSPYLNHNPILLLRDLKKIQANFEVLLNTI